MVLFNSDTYTPRMRFTLFHEIGHVRLGHTRHGQAEEEDANYYASQVMAPTAILREIVSKGYVISKRLLVECFGLSRAAAEMRMGELNSGSFFEETDLDYALKRQFSEYLFVNYPLRHARVSIDIINDD